jgi:hypothetical protein
MIAKNITLITKWLNTSSLQSSLQNPKLSHWLKQTFCLQTSLQVLADLPKNSKENKTDLQLLNKIYFVSLFATITKLQQLSHLLMNKIQYC